MVKQLVAAMAIIFIGGSAIDAGNYKTMVNDHDLGLDGVPSKGTYYVTETEKPEQEPIQIFRPSKPEELECVTPVKKKKKHKKVKIRKYKIIKCKLTAYCPCIQCSEGYGRHTSTGNLATQGRTIAVDPHVIPYGSKVIIDGHTYRAEDCGGGVGGRHVDVYFNNHSSTDKFGVKYKKVKVML